MPCKSTFNYVVVSVLIYGFTTWILTKPTWKLKGFVSGFKHIQQAEIYKIVTGRPFTSYLKSHPKKPNEPCYIRKYELMTIFYGRFMHGHPSGGQNEKNYIILLSVDTIK